ncbi:hypothetical protein PtA15_17A411 [Puccinia triticina]|uniref:CCHC-type domain-containing protein n=1 Tax=Puccinia triticina TaxID=208348 RepID=A0ABY7D5N8_9BASI|nr:uncharacterized protein PtA15_17A411 [Puccinia triticina]WAQ92929.1 hypothetical protein PtA15_17A411 [Puccinia triticina]
MFGNYIKSMPKLNDADERRKQSSKPGPAQVKAKYTRGSTSSGKASSSTRCQKCEKFGHYTYNCPAAQAPYKARPSRTQQLLNPKPQRDTPSVEVPEEFLTKKGIAEKILATNELKRHETISKPPASKPSKSSDSSDSGRHTRKKVKRTNIPRSKPRKSGTPPLRHRHRHRSRSVSPKANGSQTPPSSGGVKSPSAEYRRPRSPSPKPVGSRTAVKPRQKSPSDTLGVDFPQRIVIVLVPGLLLEMLLHPEPHRALGVDFHRRIVIGVVPGLHPDGTLLDPALHPAPDGDFPRWTVIAVVPDQTDPELSPVPEKCVERLGIKDAQDLAQDLLSGRIDLQLRLAPDESIQTSEKDLHLDLRDFHHHPVPDEAPGLAVALQDGQAKRLITVAPILNIVTKRLPEIVIGVSSGTSASNNGPLVMTVIIDSFQNNLFKCSKQRVFPPLRNNLKELNGFISEYNE